MIKALFILTVILTVIVTAAAAILWFIIFRLGPKHTKREQFSYVIVVTLAITLAWYFILLNWSKHF